MHKDGPNPGMNQSCVVKEPIVYCTPALFVQKLKGMQ